MALTRLIVRLSINLPFISASRRGGFSRNAGRLRPILGSAALAAAAGFAPAQSAERVLYSFKGGIDGAIPAAGLIFDSKGALYGTTRNGGGFSNPNFGTVFKLTPPAPEQTLWTEKVLYSFKGGADGGGPLAGLIADTTGALYGTTSGQNLGNGTVFKLTPPAAGKTLWTETVLYSFKGGTNGAVPVAGLIFGSKDGLFGTTQFGGTSNFGTVFKLKPPAPGQTLWTEKVLYSFTGGTDGGRPAAGLIFGSKDGLFGTTQFGGTSGNGTVFKLKPPAPGHTLWTEKVLYSFKGGTDGGRPTAGLIFDAHGALYGTTNYLGFVGTVFKLTPPAAGQTLWTETVLYTSMGGTDGARLDAGLIFDASGALYSTTFYGGTSGFGTVFKLTPPVPPATKWTESVLYSFKGGPTGFGDGSNPAAGLIFGSKDGLFGTTFGGGNFRGASNDGTVFKLKQ
ncbi:MAG: choice-of-anchor tandem repeat GloVer-containing protein [Methylocella sp.]